MVSNNLGVAHKNKGNWQDAFLNLNNSYNTLATTQAAFNLGVMYEKSANYTRSSELFDKAKGVPGAYYDAGLSKLLMSDYTGAKLSLEKAVSEDKSKALTYYLLAIVGARSGDTNLMTYNLKRSVQLDPSFSDKARKDLEFLKYYETAEFKAASKRD